MPHDSPPRMLAARPSQSLCGSPPHWIGYRWLPVQPARAQTMGKLSWLPNFFVASYTQRLYSSG